MRTQGHSAPPRPLDVEADVYLVLNAGVAVSSEVILDDLLADPPTARDVQLADVQRALMSLRKQGALYVEHVGEETRYRLREHVARVAGFDMAKEARKHG